MSTEIKIIKGEVEDYHGKKINSKMSLNRFYGGDKGLILQLTLDSNHGYIQLTKKQTFKLARVLLNSFDKDIYPSE